jgi:hypothetical protein
MKRLAFALAVVPLLLTVGAAPTSAAAADAHVRLVYLSPDDALGAVDFYVDSRRALSGAVYDTTSTYLSVTPGQHTFEVRKAGAAATAAPQAQVQQSLNAGYYSVFAGGKVGGSTCPVKAVIFSDDFATPPAGKVAARFVHMAPEVPGVDVVLSQTPSTVLFNNVSCFQGSSYSTFPTGSYPVALVATGSSTPVLFQTNADLTRAGVVYTLVGAGGVNQEVSLVKILDAASAGSAPQGAAATGEGGMALRGLLPLGLIASSLIACALLLLFVRRSPV